MNVLALDASNRLSFNPSTVIRDLNKAWVGFKHSTNVISTGHWGCGAFGGDETFKFLQQVCVATILDKKLEYSTFKSQEFKNDFNSLLEQISRKSKTVGDVIQALLAFNSHDTTSFRDYIFSWIAK